MSETDRDEVVAYLLGEEEAVDPSGDSLALVKGSYQADALLACITSQQDSRALFVIHKIDPDTCERL